jgi:hypothetical protein
MLFVRYRRAFEHLRLALKPAIAFELWSTLIFMISFAPATGWLLNRLVAASGQFAVSDNDLVAFFLSAQGILFLLFSIGFVLTFWFAEQIGLLIISVRAAYECCQPGSMGTNSASSCFDSSRITPGRGLFSGQYPISFRNWAGLLAVAGIRYILLR